MREERHWNPKDGGRDSGAWGSSNVPGDGFESAMYSIANNAEARVKGIFNSVTDGSSDKALHDNLTWAMAQKLNVGSAQHSNEKALLNILKEKGAVTDLKQALKARAAVYGASLDPSYFGKGKDLSKKTKTPRERRVARGMPTGSVLFAAQIGAHNVRKLLTDGDRVTLNEMRPDTRGTAAQFMKALAQAPVLQIIERVNGEKYQKLKERLLQQGDDLDFLQNVVKSATEEPALNPVTNAISDAFSRRRFSGRFKTPGKSLELDTLLHQSTKGTLDDDDIDPVSLGNSKQEGSAGFSSRRPCFAFQSGGCNRKQCNFRHVCLVCRSESHGSDRCNKQRGSSYDSSNPFGAKAKTKPPHPRYRRDRAKDVFG